MAESAAKSVTNLLGKLLVEEGKYLWGAEGKVAELRNELVWMQCFLRDADALQHDDEIVSMWVLQIKEYVSEAEDIVDKFVLEVASRRRQTGCLNKLKRWSCIMKELYVLHQVASRIDSLNRRISMLTPRLQTYGLETAYRKKSYRTREAISEQAQQRMSYVHLESKKIVGLKKDTRKIVNSLLYPKARMVAIYGMGGLGKTTLATKVYNHDKVKEYFKGRRAWIYISKQFRLQHVLQKLIVDLTAKSIDLIAGKDYEALTLELREFTKKNNCLVVLDDVWKTGVWDSLNAAFPSEGCSKILLTTRKEDVAKLADSELQHKPDPLSKQESWTLLQLTMGWKDAGNEEEKVRKSSDLEEISESSSCKKVETGSGVSNGEKDFETHVSGRKEDKRAQPNHLPGSEIFENDGYEVRDLGLKMVQHCDGIPLAIIALGGILRKKETVKEWRIVYENIAAYLRRGSDHGRSYMDVLVLSYNDLPYHLKPCFLHLGNFPGDYEIQTEKLYRIWVAEGLVSWPHDRVSSTETLEDIANDYLNDLADAGMVQIMNKGSDGRIKSVRIHDLVRDVCLQKATIENFFSIIDHRLCPNEPEVLSSSSNHARLLRIAIYLARGVTNYLPDLLTSKAHKYLRSLLFFGGQEVDEGEIEQWMTCICEEFQWLRVLDIEGLRLKGRLTGDVQKVKRLRYLSLKETNVSELPSIISDLSFLQCLDLRVSFAGSLKIPNTLWKLHRLRHLFLPKKPYEIKKSDFLRLDTLSYLETLKNLEPARIRVEDLQKLKRLKKLSIKDEFEVDMIMIIAESPAVKSGSLRSCSFGIKGSVIDVKPSILSNFNCLHRLNVVGMISHLKDNVLPQSLEVLHLKSCALNDDIMRILGSLHHLKDLSLGQNSFVGKQMICKAGSFPQLTVLNLQGLAKLENWTLDQGSMPRLKKLVIMDCVKLKRIPDDLPSFVRVTCSPCIDGIEKYNTCSYNEVPLGVADYEEVHIERADDMRSLLNLFLNGRTKKVVLWGIGGVGKATLAKMLYGQSKVKEHFTAIAWGRWPSKEIHSSPRRFVQDLLRQLDPIESDRLMSQSVSVPILGLHEVMRKKKCLVILTDLAGSLEAVDEIFRPDIPDGSKVLLLTIDKPSSKDSDKVATLNLKPLPRDESLDLLKRRLGDALSESDGDIKAELEEIMLEHCSGQPLSIIMLAGILTVKKSLTDWQNIQKDIALRLEKDQGAQLIYALSYDNLPPHLKSCFLYLANFPEDVEISTSKLYRMWIAAGLFRLKVDADLSKRREDDNVEGVKFWENVAASYLNELVLRGMVQVVKRRPNRSISTCRLHSAVRSLCLEKAREERFATIIHQAESSSSASDESLGRWKRWYKSLKCTCCFRNPLPNLCIKMEKEVQVTKISRLDHSASASSGRFIAEHLAIHSIEEKNLNILASNPGQPKSLLFFPEASDVKIGESNWRGESNWQWFIKICNFQFLRVLDLEGMWMTKGALPAEVKVLSQLRYLSLRGTWVSELPSTIEQLSNLETLDLRVMDDLFIPDVLFNFEHLRHLYLPDSIDLMKSQMLRLHGLNQLQTLANLHTDKVNLDFVFGLKSLRKISIKNIHAKNDLDDKLKFINRHTHVSINSEIISGSFMLSKFQNLHKVTIKGRISVPLTDGMFPGCLKELKLKHTAIKDDPIPVLAKLPGLKELTFDEDSFLGEEMIFSVGFPQLTHLTLRLLSNLKELDMSTAADHLRHIEPLIIDCWRLNVKGVTTATAEIKLGPLGDLPVLSVLTQTFIDSWTLNPQETTLLPAKIQPGPLGDHPVMDVLAQTFTDSWPLKVKGTTMFPTTGIQLRPLGDHPVMAVLTQTSSDGWQPKVMGKTMFPTTGIQLRPLGDHPVMAVLTQSSTDGCLPKVKITTSAIPKIHLGQLGSHPVMAVLTSDTEAEGMT